MNRRTILQAIAMAAAVAATSRGVAAQEGTPPAQAEPVYGQAARLQYAQSFTTNDGMSIRLVGIEDHRCPEDALCYWEGYAAVWLEISGPDWPDLDLPTRIRLVVSADYADAQIVGPLLLILTEFSPTPRPRVEMSLDEYEVGLVVIELPEQVGLLDHSARAVTTRRG